MDNIKTDDIVNVIFLKCCIFLSRKTDIHYPSKDLKYYILPKRKILTGLTAEEPS